MPTHYHFPHTPVSPQTAADVAGWLGEHQHECLSTEMIVRALPIGDTHVWLEGADVTRGIALRMPDAQCFVDATDETAAHVLVEALLSDERPAKVTAGGRVRPWIEGALRERASLAREHRLLAMACRRAVDIPVLDEGVALRWAAEGDEPALARYAEAYGAERGVTIRANWPREIEARRIAVATLHGELAAVVRRNGGTPRYECIGGTYTLPALRRRGLGTAVTAFASRQILAECKSVHLIVDDDNAAAIATYRKLGFEELGSCWMAYLQ